MMAKLVRHLVPFHGTRSVTGPFTWRQRQIWRDMEVVPEAAYQVTQVMPVPGGLTVEDVLARIGVIVSRHEALRSLFGVDHGGEPGQRVLSAGVVAVDVLTVESRGETDLGRVLREAESGLADRPYDPAADLPFRALVCVIDDAPGMVILCASHLAADLTSMRLLVGELSEEVSAAAEGRAPTPPPRSRTPVDQALWEGSAEGRGRLEAALRYWAEQLALAPPQIFPPAAGPASTPRFWRGGLVSRAVPVALRTLATACHTTTSMVLLAATAALLGRMTGRPRCALRLVAPNRLAPELRYAVGHLAQEIVATIDVDGELFEDVVRETWSAAVRAYRHGLYDPRHADRLVRDVAVARGTVIDLSCYYDDQWVDPCRRREWTLLPPADLRAALADTVFRWEDRTEEDSLTFSLEVYDVFGEPDMIRISLMADTRYIPPGSIEAFLRGLERLLVTLTDGEVRLAEIHRPAGAAGGGTGDGTDGRADD
ncbi:hypothetical protein JOL79_02985 [Microbispora sp. RL4-1S]|uniref:Condensation domain-containing protein n=1 Tax=Microbispora oryzae TaxID=2806554 RepID=A0A940WC64_9ACTN|nr:condensation domain-containing protein [Microbispora oryzae]MBP2702766.1 hypothetical protein [Microbispora oryzae]